MNNQGFEGRRDEGGSRISAAASAGPAGPQARKADLVFDFSDMDEMTVQDLSFLLTAQRMASKEDRVVWATGVPMETWNTLHAMGLSALFRPFPTEGNREA